MLGERGWGGCCHTFDGCLFALGFDTNRHPYPFDLDGFKGMGMGINDHWLLLGQVLGLCVWARNNP